MTFNKLRALTSEKAVVVEAIKTSPKLLELSPDESKLRRRSRDLPKPDDGVDVSVFTEGWPVTFKLHDIQAVLSASGNKPLFIKMRRGGPDQKDFLGSCFVEFDTAEEMQRCVDSQASISVPSASIKVEPLATWLKRNEGGASAASSERRKAATPKDIQLPLGCILVFEGVDTPKTREEFRTLLGSKSEGEEEKIAYVDYDATERMVKVRFRSAQQAKIILEKVPEIKEIVHTKCYLLEGDAEAAYLDMIKQASSAKSSAKSSGKRGGGRERDGDRKRAR